MATKEVSNFYFFKSKKTEAIPIPIDELPTLHLVSCTRCGNSFASKATPKLSKCSLCHCSKVVSIREFKGAGRTRGRDIRIELAQAIAERNNRNLNRFARSSSRYNMDWANIMVSELPYISEYKFEFENKSWLYVGSADLPGTGSTLNRKKFISFLGKNSVYHVKQSPGRANWSQGRPGGGETKFEFFFIGSEAKFRNKGPYEIDNRRTGPGIYFYYKGRLYLSDSKEEVLAYVDGVGTKEDDDSRRERIPDDTQIFVWNRDGGACVKCGIGENLAFDHIIPHSLGGSNSRRNLQLLCDSCNSKKGNKVGG